MQFNTKFLQLELYSLIKFFKCKVIKLIFKVIKFIFKVIKLINKLIKFCVLFLKIEIISKPLYINEYAYVNSVYKLYVEYINCMYILLIARFKYKLLDKKLTR